MTTLKPFTIGNIQVDIPIALAPMSQVTTHAYRKICKTIGGLGIVYTELLSSKGLSYRNQKTVNMLDWRPTENPLAVQIFGSEPDVMAEGARFVVEMGAQIVDINMGCWVPKVAGKGAGAALLRDVDTATRVVEAVVNAVDVPVTVKVRAGFDMGVVTAVDFAKAAESVGVQLIAVHGRFAAQGFKGEADWSVIGDVKQAVQIPVLGNGDINTPQDAKRMLEMTNCDGVMIGRAAMGNPWIFKQIHHYLATGEELAPPSDEERVLMAVEHARLAVATTKAPERVTCLRLRSQLPPYLKGISGKRWANEALKHVESLKEVEGILFGILDPKRIYYVDDHNRKQSTLIPVN